MPDFTQGRDLTPGFIARVAAGARFMLTGRAPDDWFGPQQPQQPVAPKEVAGRQWDFPPGYNLVVRPRAYEPIGFPQLRALADSYDLLRLVIETRKDQLSRLHWSLSPRNQTRRAKDDPRCATIRDFLSYPDREHGWDEWIRMLVEDMLVLDAATIFPRRTMAGGIYALEPIDGATIKLVIDDHGRVPLPPDPAYQQVLKGLPATNYTKDELFYLPRNPRTDRVYGYSPVEQIIMSVNIALRRQMHQLQYYTEGSVPDSLIGVPESWSPDQIGQFQAYWDALLEGNTAQRRHARFVPATISKSFVQTKDAALKDEYDEWLARIICYAFNVSNQWAVKQMNRATADTAQEQSQREGLEPLMAWVKGMMDRILARTFQAPDLEFQWAEEQQVDPSKQADINKLYLSAGVRSINEVRQDLGLDPIPGGEVHLIYTAQGAVPLADIATPHPTLPLKGGGLVRRDAAPFPLRGEGRGGGEADVAKAYNPDEPRVPAGSPDGGQWTSEGGTGGAAAAVSRPASAANVTARPLVGREYQVASNDAIQSDTPTLPGNNDQILAYLDTVPAYRAQAINQYDWDIIRTALAASGVSADQQYVYSEIFAAEGGFKSDGTAVAGITQQALDAAKAAKDADGNPLYPDLAAAITPDDLTAPQMVTVYGVYFDDALKNAGGAGALQSIGDPRTAAAVADTIFREGAPHGVPMVQTAVDTVLGQLSQAQKDQLGFASRPIPVDGQFGYQTLGTLTTLAQAGYGNQLRAEIANLRLKGSHGSEIPRIDHFR